MDGVLIAETAELFGLHTVGMVLFFLGRVVVALLAVHAGQCDLRSHAYPSLLTVLFHAHKKKARAFASFGW
jgi:hypothetical protein